MMTITLAIIMNNLLMKSYDDPLGFMRWFKVSSEKHFENLELDSEACGLQHQKGTKWKKGLSDTELYDFQKQIGFEFPDELVAFYKTMNGTDLPGVNIYGDSGQPYTYAPIYFAYPDHVPLIKELINERLKVVDSSLESIRVGEIPGIFPIDGFYFVIFDGKTNPVYYLPIAYRSRNINKSYVYGSLWADNLQSWLIKAAFHRTEHSSDLVEFTGRERLTNFWTTED